MTSTDPLASLRASLKAGKSLSKTAPPSKPDPLATLRAQIKAGKIKPPPAIAPGPAPVGIRGVTQP